MRQTRWASLLVLSLLAPAWLPAAGYPEKPVRLVVPFTPGGSSDIVGRLVGNKLVDYWGQPLVIDNRAGAGGAVGAETVARSAPDGYTLLFANPGPALHNVVLRRKPTYALADFAPVIYIGYSPNIIVANLKFPASGMKELVAYARQNPGRVNWASPGTGSNPHIAIEMLKAATGINVVHVPYKGAAQAMTDVVAGQVDVQYASLASAEPFIKAARLKVIGVSGPKRLSALPEVPTFAEQGMKVADSMLWFGFLTAARTPRAVVEKVNADVNRVLQQPDIRSRLEQLGMQPEGGAPERFSALIRSEAERLAPLAKSGAIRIE
jgi:tripartite-type tricarboxylate transporter receptor subunit TctC